MSRELQAALLNKFNCYKFETSGVKMSTAPYNNKGLDEAKCFGIIKKNGIDVAMEGATCVIRMKQNEFGPVTVGKAGSQNVAEHRFSFKNKRAEVVKQIVSVIEGNAQLTKEQKLNAVEKVRTLAKCKSLKTRYNKVKKQHKQ